VNPDPVLLNDWHPVALSQEIAAGAITATDLLDTRLALWRDSGGALHAWEDRCPHRGTRLSMGALHNDTLRCAYHGWTFGSEGRCKHIPALPVLGEANLKAQVATHHVQECYGLIWVCLGEPAAPAPPAAAMARCSLASIRLARPPKLPPLAPLPLSPASLPIASACLSAVLDN